MSFLGKCDFLWFVMVFDKSSVSLLYVFAHIVQQNLFEESSDLKTIIRPYPIYLVLKALNHPGRQFYLAVARYARFQVIDVSRFNGQALQIINRWCAIEPTDLQNCRITFSHHAFSERLKKYSSRNLQVNQSTHGNFSRILDWQQFHDGLCLVRRPTDFVDDRFFSRADLRFGD